jgi:lipopolysaccharide/colanic/teichoic acid biosynthesis glycosyltransferase
VSAALSIAGIVILFVVAIAFAVLKTLLTDEARAWLPHIARALARATARRLPVEHRKRYEEEWLAEIDAYSDRPLSAVVRAVGLRLHARDMARTLSERRTVPVVDRVIAGVALVVLAPLFVAIAIAIKLDSPGPALFLAPRSFGGRPFGRLKFRTLHADAQQVYWFTTYPIESSRLVWARKEHRQGWPAPGESWAAKTKAAYMLHILRAALRDTDSWAGRWSEPRVTRVGRYLRATAFDQLPMLVNVLRGDMPLAFPWRVTP